MIVIAGKNDIAVYGLTLALQYFDTNKVVALTNKNDNGIDGWQRSFYKFAKENGVQVKTLEYVYENNVDVFISLEFDRIVDPAKINTDRIYNIHFSKLPKYKGMYTSVWPVLLGDDESAVTLHKIDTGIDTGDILAQRCFALTDEDRSQDLYRKYIDNSKVLLREIFGGIVKGTLAEQVQCAEGSTYYSKSSIDFSNVSLDFNQTAWQLKRQLYAFSFRPYQLLSFNGKNVASVVITKNKSIAKPGAIVSETSDYIKTSTIDFDVKLYFDDLDGFLLAMPEMSLGSVGGKLLKTLGVNDKNDKGWSPIIVAAYYGRVDIINLLLEKGADVNDRNYRGTTVLMYAKDYALRECDNSIISHLVSKGADPYLEDWSGKTLFDYISDKEAHFLGL